MKRKKIICLLFTIAFVLLFSCTLFACADDGIYNLKAKYDYSVQLPLNGTINIGNYITYEGKGKLSYSVENPEVLSLKGDKVTGIAAGSGKVIVSTKTETVSINVIVVNPNEITVEAIDTEHIYDGTAKNLDVLAPNLPEGSIIKYYLGEQEFFGAVDPGQYLITVEVILPDKFSANYINKSATLTVDRAVVSMSNIKFSSKSYDYDGTQKEITITGELPSFVSVSYQNNKGTDAGNYDAKANFTVDTKYYYEIMPLSARLTIKKVSLNYSSLGFANKTVIYSGDFECIAFESLPQGFTVDYYLNSVSSENKIEDIENRFKNVGVYPIVAKLNAEDVYKKNYVFESVLNATLEIKKAEFINNLTWNDVPTVYTYDGVGVSSGVNQSVSVSGDKPVGLKGEFPQGADFTYYYKVGNGVPITAENKTQIDAGIYTVAVRFTMPDGYDTNYNKLSDMEFSFVINKASYDMQNVVFEGETFTFDGATRIYSVQRPIGFDNDILIKYALNENGTGFTAYTESPYSVKDVGSYQIRAIFTYKTEALLKNYRAIEAKTIAVSVNRLAVDLGNITFESLSYIYDKNEIRSLAVIGTVPSNIAVSYSANNSQTNAGVYTIDANFAYTIEGNEVLTKNYYFTQNSQNANAKKTAVLTINKASYTQLDVPAYHANGGVYSPNTKLSSYIIYNEENIADPNVRWANQNIIPTVNNAGYTAHYNADSANYNNYALNISLAITKAVVDGSTVSISSQFLPRTGITVIPLYTINGAADTKGVLKTVIQGENPLIEWGEYPVSVSFELNDTVNYNFENIPIPKAITIYIYNGGQFIYEGTQLTEYIGTGTVLSVPSGTTSIRNGAIKNKSNLTEIVLPSTLIKTGISNGAINLTNMPLARITLPFIGVNGNDTFASLFGLTNSNLPQILEYVTVTNENTITTNAFKDGKYLRSIVYANEVQSVGESAFNGCKELRTLTIGSIMTSLGQNAFRNCFNIINLSLPFIGSNINDTLSTIAYLLGENAGENAYTNYFLSTLTITGNITSLPDFAFKGLVRAGTINLPNTITSIGKEAFGAVKANVNLNNNITQITDQMFKNYQGTALSLPSTVIAIGSYAFSGASNLASLTIPKSVLSVGEYAFKGVKCIVSFEQGTAISTLGQNTFREYLGGGFVIPSTVHTLGNYAFYGSEITSIIIPLTVNTLGEGVFENSAKLKTVTLYNTQVAAKMFYNCDALTTINFEGVTIIGVSAFESCDSLTSIMLKANVKTVKEYAFYNCASLNSCEIRANEVITLYATSFPFRGETNRFIIRVHNTSAYETAYPSFANIYQFLAWQS